LEAAGALAPPPQPLGVASEEEEEEESLLLQESKLEFRRIGMCGLAFLMMEDDAEEVVE